MGIIRWTDKFSVNDARIDNQHKKWIKIFNNAHTRMMDYSVTEGLSIGKEALKEMVSYTKFHFAFEEELIENWFVYHILEEDQKYKEYTK